MEISKEQKLEVLSNIGKLLNDVNITWAVGASLLLYFKGIAQDFHDIDIMVVEEDVSRLKERLLSVGTLNPSNPNEKYRTKHFLEFVVEEVDVDVMAGFVIVNDGQEYDCSLKEEQIVDHVVVNDVKIPLQSVSLWREYYRLMGREKKVDMIDSFKKSTLEGRKNVD